MAEERIPPAGLHPRLVERLLDNLEGNEAFRKQFQASPEQALRSLGYTDPWDCMATLAAGTELASPELIRTQRRKLEAAMVGIQKMSCALAAQEAGKL
ncbi:MAG TPA: NHLP-related RiPP peptide [Luteimonas sp.]|jgi:putative modified peptide|nr:NHLP-related RiPP peptide [Luteimonas sp.]